MDQNHVRTPGGPISTMDDEPYLSIGEGGGTRDAHSLLKL